MYVCICRQITDKQIRELCENGAGNLGEVRDRLGRAPNDQGLRVLRLVLSEGPMCPTDDAGSDGSFSATRAAVVSSI